MNRVNGPVYRMPTQPAQNVLRRRRHGKAAAIAGGSR